MTSSSQEELNMTSVVYTNPQNAPLYEAPPYDYKSFTKVSVFCRVDEAALRKALPAEFEVRGNVIEFFIMDVPNGGALGAYAEGGVVVPMSYKGQPGGHVLYEIVTNDDSMAVGREVWGYPKKMGEVSWSQDGTSIKTSLSRRGVPLIEIEFDAADAEFEKPALQPRFQTRLIPSPEGATAKTEIIENSLKGFSYSTHSKGKAKISIGGNAADPFHELAIEEVIGAEMIVADFVLGFGKVVG